ncbi:MAG: TIGR04255 family protein [Candidatus Tectomicrobia bacterium]|nr:TIGR04255 family protein [Candidatus Tectomicrobia bacterium]
MGRKYKNPPLLEVVCEFRFDPNSPWDLAIPGLIYEKLRNTFPKRRQTKLYEGAVSAGPEGVQQQIKEKEGLRFLREDGAAFLQLSPHLLEVHHLKPYPTWEGFLPLIDKSIRVYIDIASPSRLQRIGLRYINRIDLHGVEVKLEDNFNLYPFVGSQLGNFGHFFLGLKIPFERGRDLLQIQMAMLMPDKPDVIPILLDLDYFLAQPGQLKLGDQIAWLNQAHEQIELKFEGCLKDSLREQFEEVKS